MRIVLLVIILLLDFADLANAHPGRLTKSTGCHQVNRNYKYKSGAVANAGDYHCHRGLDSMRFDGLEVLREEEESPNKEKTKTKTSR